MTTEETIERGLAAASLLSEPTFQSVLKALCYEQFASFTETLPAEASKREDTYNLYRGLMAIEAELNARVLAKDEAVLKLDAVNEDHSELEGPIYTQGNTDR